MWSNNNIFKFYTLYLCLHKNKMDQIGYTLSIIKAVAYKTLSIFFLTVLLYNEYNDWRVNDEPRFFAKMGKAFHSV